MRAVADDYLWQRSESGRIIGPRRDCYLARIENRSIRIRKVSCMVGMAWMIVSPAWPQLTRRCQTQTGRLELGRAGRTDPDKGRQLVDHRLRSPMSTATLPASRLPCLVTLEFAESVPLFLVNHAQHFGPENP